MSTTQPLISIIIPVYNVKDYLEKCLDSICGQTYTNLEIIVVDDGSTDGSAVICDKFAQKDRRVKVLHCANGGLSVARNRGMEIATGELIGFVDSDDWIETDMYQCLYDSLSGNDADVAICSSSHEEGDKSSPLSASGVERTLTPRDCIYEMLKSKSITHCVWTKLYKTYLWQGVPFPAGKHFEDLATMHHVIARAKKIAVIDKPLYHYLIRDGSIMRQKYFSLDDTLTLFEFHLERSRFLSQYDNAVLSAATNKVAHKGIQLIDRVVLQNENDENKAAIAKVLDGLAAINRSLLRPDLRLKCWLLLRHYSLYTRSYLFFRRLFKSRVKFN